MIKIIVADDQELIRKSIEIMLSAQEGFEVVAVTTNGAETLEAAKKHRPDVILMDVFMPVMNGVECTRQIKELYPEIKILMLTTFEDDEYVFSALAYGASGYLLKGITLSELANAVTVVHGGGSLINPTIASKVIRQFARMARSNQPRRTGAKEAEALTKTELAIIQCVGNGLSNKEISRALFLGEGTVRNYISVILEKLELRDRTQLAIYALQTGIVQMEETL